MKLKDIMLSEINQSQKRLHNSSLLFVIILHSICPTFCRCSLQGSERVRNMPESSSKQGPKLGFKHRSPKPFLCHAPQMWLLVLQKHGQSLGSFRKAGQVLRRVPPLGERLAQGMQGPGSTIPSSCKPQFFITTRQLFEILQLQSP